MSIIRKKFDENISELFKWLHSNRNERIIREQKEALIVILNRILKNEMLSDQEWQKMKPHPHTQEDKLITPQLKLLEHNISQLAIWIHDNPHFPHDSSSGKRLLQLLTLAKEREILTKDEEDEMNAEIKEYMSAAELKMNSPEKSQNLKNKFKSIRLKILKSKGHDTKKLIEEMESIQKEIAIEEEKKLNPEQKSLIITLEKSKKKLDDANHRLVEAIKDLQKWRTLDSILSDLDSNTRKEMKKLLKNYKEL